MAILIVDDSIIVRSVVKQALNMFGYKDTLEAEDGIIGKKLFLENQDKIEICIFDVNMPNMDGITLIKEVKKVKPGVPVIILTTETDKAKMLTAKENGAAGWIIKPFEAHNFIKVIELLIPKKS